MKKWGFISSQPLFKNHLNLFQHDILAEPFFRDLLGFAAGYDLGDAVIQEIDESLIVLLDPDGEGILRNDTLEFFELSRFFVM